MRASIKAWLIEPTKKPLNYTDAAPFVRRRHHDIAQHGLATGSHLFTRTINIASIACVSVTRKLVEMERAMAEDMTTVVAAERERLTKERSDIETKVGELRSQLAEVDHKLGAIDAYETAL